MKKINVFLGAYLNRTNAQNLSCLSLARFLDKQRFRIYSLEVYDGDFEVEPIDGLKTYKCFFPIRISGYLGHLWGIWNCDIAFLPRAEFYKWNSFLLKVLRKKSFKTIENILDDVALPSIIAAYGSISNIVEGYSICDRLYSISYFMKDYNFRKFKIKSEDKILRLATDTLSFLNESKETTYMQNVVFIGNDMRRKGIYDYLYLAERFPSLTFHVVGSGQNQVNVSNEIAMRRLKNVIYHGILNHVQLKDLLRKTDLHILPSRSEGFPKVTLETAAAGVPSLLYPDYGAEEWIVCWENGIVVGSKEDMADAIIRLQTNPDDLKKLSKGAIQLGKQYDLRLIVKEYEAVLVDLVSNP